MKKIIYRNTTIELDKAEEGGYSVCITDNADNFVIDGSWYHGCRTLKMAIADAKITVDDYWASPDDYRN